MLNAKGTPRGSDRQGLTSRDRTRLFPRVRDKALHMGTGWESIQALNRELGGPVRRYGPLPLEDFATRGDEIVCPRRLDRTDCCTQYGRLHDDRGNVRSLAAKSHRANVLGRYRSGFTPPVN